MQLPHLWGLGEPDKSGGCDLNQAAFDGSFSSSPLRGETRAWLADRGEGWFQNAPLTLTLSPRGEGTKEMDSRSPIRSRTSFAGMTRNFEIPQH